MQQLSQWSAPGAVWGALAEEEAPCAVPAVRPPLQRGAAATNDPWVIEFRAGEVAVRRLAEVRAVSFSRAELLAGDDVLVAFDLWSPGCTDRPEGDQSARKRSLRARKLRVQSELIKRGGVTLHDGGRSFVEDDCALIYWSLSSPENKTGRRSAAGVFPLRFSLGAKALGSFQLRWNPA